MQLRIYSPAPAPDIAAVYGTTAKVPEPATALERPQQFYRLRSVYYETAYIRRLVLLLRMHMLDVICDVATLYYVCGQHVMRMGGAAWTSVGL